MGCAVNSAIELKPELSPGASGRRMSLSVKMPPEALNRAFFKASVHHPLAQPADGGPVPEKAHRRVKEAIEKQTSGHSFAWRGD